MHCDTYLTCKNDDSRVHSCIGHIFAKSNYSLQLSFFLVIRMVSWDFGFHGIDQLMVVDKDYFLAQQLSEYSGHSQFARARETVDPQKRCGCHDRIES